jgi:hypothetical protein
MDIDLTIKSLASRDSTRGRGRAFLERSRAPIDLTTIIETTTLSIDAEMETWRQEKVDKVKAIAGYDRLNCFHALPMSTGGYCDGPALRILKAWKDALGPSSYVYMIQTISVKLVKFRAFAERA